MKLYIKVTKDEYELPVAVADSIPKLAQMVHVKPNSLRSMICKVKKGSKKYPYRIVEVDDD